MKKTVMRILNMVMVVQNVDHFVNFISIKFLIFFFETLRERTENNTAHVL